jgi:hypothetical protein
MKERIKIESAYKAPEIEILYISISCSLLTGSTSPDSVYTDGGDAW